MRRLPRLLLPLPVAAALVRLSSLPALPNVRLSPLWSRLALHLALASRLRHHAPLRQRLHLRLSSLPPAAVLAISVWTITLSSPIPAASPRCLRQCRRHLVVRNHWPCIHGHNRASVILAIELLPVLHHLLP